MSADTRGIVLEPPRSGSPKGRRSKDRYAHRTERTHLKDDMLELLQQRIGPRSGTAHGEEISRSTPLPGSALPCSRGTYRAERTPHRARSRKMRSHRAEVAGIYRGHCPACRGLRDLRRGG